ncbi:MAG: HmuY family protein [Myxococcota bacterium]|nr:HmuY family protein [Myxococcota bacterium]
MKVILWLVLLLFVGCSSDTDESDITPSTEADVAHSEGSDVAVPGSVPTSELVTTAKNEDGSWLTAIDASSTLEWVYFDIDSGEEATADAGWDLAFQRSNIMVNGGVSGTGDVSVSVLPGVDFGTLIQAPSAGYETDEANPDDVANPEYVFAADGGWYDYDVTTHTLTARDRIYIVKSTDGGWFKIKFEDYYRGGDGGYPSFQWAAVEAPLESSEYMIDATDGWVYVNLDGKAVVEPADVSTSTNWDIAFNDAQVQTNSGTSGAGYGGGQATEGTWEDITSSDSVGYSVDKTLPVPGPPGSGEYSGNPALSDWYDYDVATHTLSPKDAVFLVRASDGDYFKLRILTYESGVYTIETETLTRSLLTHTTTFPADMWTQLSFASAAVGASNSEPWDIGINGVQCRTNSGTTGPGEGGVLLADSSSLNGVSEVPRSGCYFLAKGHICECDITAQECTEQQGAWTPQCACDIEPVPDSMLALPGPPGAGEYSGNSVLEGWYDYDFVTHTVTPTNAVFLIRDSNGSWAKLQFTDYVEGAVTVSWVWAGPGRFDF